MKTFYKMIWIVRALWLVYKCVFIALWSTKIRGQYGWLCLQVVRIYSFVKEIKLYIRASYIFFLFVKTENNNFIKKIKHVLRPFTSRWTPSTASWVFTDLLSNSHKRLPWFSPGYEGTENMFYFLNEGHIDCVTGFHWSALEFSQTFALVFTRLRRHEKMFYFRPHCFPSKLQFSNFSKVYGIKWVGELAK